MRAALLLAMATLVSEGAVTARADTISPGDRENGAALFRVQCAACHGVDGRGDGDLASKLPVSVGNLRDPALLSTRSDEELKAVILKGMPHGQGPALMPGAPWLSSLDLADLLAFLRAGELKVTDFFPHAQSFTAKTYPLDKSMQAQVQKLTGRPLGVGESTVTVIAFYGAAPSGSAPQLVAQDPVQLDKLDPKDGKGYLVFGDLPLAKGHAVAGIALNRDGQVLRVLSAEGLTTPAVDKPYLSFVGQGQKATVAPIKPKGKGGTPAEDKAFNAAYARAIVGIQVADREEKDRHWADTK